MSYSRTRTRQMSKKRRHRKLLTVNLTLLVLIAVAGGLLFYQWNGASGEDAASGGSPAKHSAPSDSGHGDNGAPLTTDAGRNGGSDGNSSDGNAGNGGEGGTAEPSDDAALPPGERITLAFVGDILLGSRVGDLMDKNGVDYPFAGSADYLKEADITAANLESPVTSRGTPAENKTYVYRAKPEHVAGLKNAGIDVLTLANNHTLDQGWEGLSDTMDHLDEAGLQHIGSGADDTAAFTPAIVERNGFRVAYIGVSNVVPDVSWKADKRHPGVAETYDTRRAVAAVQDAKKLADLVVVMVHWGNENQQQPKKEQFNVGHTLIDAGADLVIGSHPHVLQGFEYYKGKWIAYSLGNFVFTMNSNALARQTGVLTATCGKDGACAMKFKPMLSNDSQPAPMEPADGAQLLSALSALSFGAEVDGDGDIVPSPSSASSPSGKETP